MDKIAVIYVDFFMMLHAKNYRPMFHKIIHKTKVAHS